MLCRMQCSPLLATLPRYAPCNVALEYWNVVILQFWPRERGLPQKAVAVDWLQKCTVACSTGSLDELFGTVSSVTLCVVPRRPPLSRLRVSTSSLLTPSSGYSRSLQSRGKKKAPAAWRGSHEWCRARAPSVHGNLAGRKRPIAGTTSGTGGVQRHWRLR